LDQNVILQVEDLQTHFFTREGVVKAVDGASFSVRASKVLGIVGESGCGKSVAALSVLGIVPRPGRVVGGRILFQRDLNGLSSKATEIVDLAALPPGSRIMRSIRGADISMVFQEPMTSLDPVYTVGNQLLEAIRLHQARDKKEARQRAIEMLASVGMPQPSQTVDFYPHQLSGGMRQRVMIAIALSCHPALLIADEPTTALDVTTEAQILDLLRKLQGEMQTAIMYITHNLGVIAEMSDDVIVMYMGKVVEYADADSLFYDPKHPYTRMLLKSIPQVGRKTKRMLEPIKGIVPDPFNVPRGCSFWPRCPDFMAGLCDHEEPPSIQVDAGHEAKCHLYH
jgi:peptide/nickel transport system ATP-binding protein